ncbi:transcription factor Tfb4 [Pisolithus marmoratus]|nr:transcription factor Tfb4 [Pisolithus marmoratus]
MESDVDKPSHLSVILDLSPTQWYLSAKATNPYPLSIESFLSQLLAFLNAHIATKNENTLAVFGAFPGKSVMLYASTETLVDEPPSLDANSYPPFKMVDTTVTLRIFRELATIEPGDEPPCALVGALTKALCYINRITLPSTSPTNVAEGSTHLPDPRILILSVSPDLSSSYIPIMNAIFSAQKLKVTIDVCKIYGPDTVFLQQAAHLTSGSYIYLERRDALLQYLIMSFLPPPSVRKVLAVPKQDKIDFRAACFCHKNIVDVGFVCSVCLSIFCQPVPVCSTCRTKFPIKALQRLKSACPSPAPATPRPLANLNNTVPRTTEATNHSTPGLR